MKKRVGNWSQNIYTIENIENKLGQIITELKVMIAVFAI